MPIATAPYRLSPAKQNDLRTEIQKMLANDIIEESESPWATNVVMVTKPDGSWRICIDFRQLNAITITDKYPMPRIDDLLQNAQGTIYVSKIDLRCGYWQIKLRH